MQWDLGWQGVAVLTAMAFVFGAFAQALGGRLATRWLWLIGAVTYFVAGILISEVLFGWATVEELQPNIDGLSFDEVLLIGLVPWAAIVVLARVATQRRRPQPA